MNIVKKFLPESSSKKIWLFLITAYSFRFTMGYYPDFVFNTYYLGAFSIDFFLNTFFYYVLLYGVPSFLLKKIKFNLPLQDFSISKYFLLPRGRTGYFYPFWVQFL